MTTSITGHCLCGSVTFSADTDPIAVVICHCEDCQRQGGAAFSVNVAIDRSALRVEGDSLQTYETIGADSGQPRERQFCSKCGSPMITILAESEGMAIIKAGTLDDKSWVEPSLEIFAENQHPWVQSGAASERTQFPRSLPG